MVSEQLTLNQLVYRTNKLRPPAAAKSLSAKTSARVGLWRPLPADGIAWLRANFSTYFQDVHGYDIPFAERHLEFWRWVWALRPGVSVDPFFAVWPRAGGKSSSVEMACSVIAYFGLRRYGLYLSSVQQQADDHVSNVAGLLEMLGVDRSVNKYGHSRGWRVNRLRTDDGFTLDAIGLEAASRGVKLEENRPDLLVNDDLDDGEDSLETLAHKERALTRKILPTGTPDIAVVGVQNLPHPDGIFTKIVQGRAEYLRRRFVSGPHPALEGCVEPWYALVEEDGSLRYRILNGAPTWAGQDMVACEAILNLIGPTAFEVELQHRTELLSMTIFSREAWRTFDAWPQTDWFDVLVQSWDATFGNEKAHGSYVAGHLWGRKNAQVFLLDRVFARLSFLDTCDAIEEMYKKWPGAYVKLIEDKANGPAIFETLRSRVFGLQLQPINSRSGSKFSRANSVAHIQKERRAWVPSMQLAPWGQEYIEHMYNFPKPPQDDGDATSQAWRYLCPPVPVKDTVRETLQHRHAVQQQLFRATQRQGRLRPGTRTRV